ncbi:hypothetical protein jhhlp_008467 [Lomentospora prolificans]|uniref:Xylanolytic transcriptional activator regulatory domain-containing protein n=1 Tax=Lomentospora prolificans TaxID=41688 RepID=A0A2N3MY50_9PEZI|nr:hypothetical protein jhhlp_008467 [Lomentospora prolificans]
MAEAGASEGPGAQYVCNTNNLTDGLLFSVAHEPVTHSPDPLAGKQSARTQLVGIFLERVDPIFKILHRPSVTLHLIQSKSYLDYEPEHPAVVALDTAIFYCAICTMNEEECASALGSGKKALLPKFRSSAEIALIRVGLVSTKDITVLQAFLLFLVATRSYDRTREVWTLMSLAFRIAQALGLHLDPPSTAANSFDLEMRRRLRYAIGLLDMQTSFDRLTVPIVPLSWMQTPYPTNTNDANFSIGFDGQLLDETGLNFTDMTFPVLIYRAQTVVRQIDMTTQEGASVMDIITLRRGYVEEFRKVAMILLRHCDTDNNPFHWYVVQVAEWIIAQFHVAVERPLRKHPNYNPPKLGFNLLQVCAEILQRSQNLVRDTRGRPWRWFESIFNPWHALSVAIAELCACEDIATVESYWDLIEKAYAHSADLMEKSQSELPWKPMEKLIKRARAHRSSLLQRGSNSQFDSATSPSRLSSFSSLSGPFTNQSQILAGPDAEEESSSQPGVFPALSFLRNLTAEETMPSTTSTALLPMPSFHPSIGTEYRVESTTANEGDAVGGDVDVSVEWATWESFLNDLYVPDNGWAFNGM